MRFRNISTAEGMSGLIEHVQETYNLALKSVGVGSLEITFQCPSLESLEVLWSDYQSGDLNDVAERYLVTDDIKKKLNLKNLTLKTTIEDENYRICKMILMEKPLLPLTSKSPLAESDQETASPPIYTSTDVCGDKKLVLTPMERAEKAKFSLTPLHRSCLLVRTKNCCQSVVETWCKRQR
ncbi:unnamed protein product [Porites lobata]|uniref:TRADD-like N-terminal domain-containing protein n=1 Tax=Porites lobata TaxID=104759 RepID=A0ABN8PQX4_9CNID|nr:unnamed protein product [Porites lobata]